MKSREEVLSMSDEEVIDYIQSGNTPEEKAARHNEIFRFGLGRAGIIVSEPTKSGELEMRSKD